MKRPILALLFALFGSLLCAQTVDRDEFSDILGQTVNFQNYQGAYARIDSLSDILAIGQGLARGLRAGGDNQADYGAKYRIHHVLGKETEPGKAADILVLLENAGVDHIDNVRRIVSAYLSSAYAYTKADADLLSYFISVYNAVHRSNLAFFQARYKASVLSYLSADKVGISLVYSDWPGKTQLVIPLSLAARQGESGGAISASSLVTPEVVETLRDTADQGIEERQKLITLLDKSSEQEQEKIDAERERLQRQRAELDQKEAALQAEIKKLEDGTSGTKNGAAGENKNENDGQSQRGTDPSGSETGGGEAARTTEDTRREQLRQEETAVADRQKALDQERTALDARQQENDETKAAGQLLRDETAKDLAKDGDASQTVLPLIFVRTRLENGLILGTAQRINPQDSSVLAQSTLTTLLGRKLQPFGSDFIALSLDKDGARLVVLKNDDLTVVKQGKEAISPHSELAVLSDSGAQECLAVLQQEGEWYLGRFDKDLNPVARSAIPVDPVGAVEVKNGTVLVQRKDGRASLLKLNDLTVNR